MVPKDNDTTSSFPPGSDPSVALAGSAHQGTGHRPILEQLAGAMLRPTDPQQYEGTDGLVGPLHGT